ncbi:MAG: hypothetical protein SFU99_01425 [Saprospiraceae bacterium]|nr:hypothetical protein [Saprospiraceae bacterium]
MKTNLLFICILLIITTACVPRLLVKNYNESKIQKIYNKSIADTAKPEPTEVDNNLLAITKETPGLVWKTINGEDYLLVSSWKGDTTYYKNDPNTGFYNTGKYIIWVTAAPQLQALCKDKKFGRKEGLDLRLKQFFGMPPNTEKKYFVEFWVRPQDLYRPCPDNEVNDKSCGLCFAENAPKEYQEWFKNQRNTSYYNCNWYDNYPWTQLGYTYDWSPRNKTHIGLSEYIIGENKKVVVNGFVTTADYCKVE